MVNPFNLRAQYPFTPQAKLRRLDAGLAKDSRGDHAIDVACSALVCREGHSRMWSISFTDEVRT